MGQDELQNRNVCIAGHLHILGKEEELELMKSHPDMGTDSSCISALPCNSFLLLSGTWDCFYCKDKLLHIGRDFGLPAKCFHSDVPSVQTKGVLIQGELLF